MSSDKITFIHSRFRVLSELWFLEVMTQIVPKKILFTISANYKYVDYVKHIIGFDFFLYAFFIFYLCK